MDSESFRTPESNAILLVPEKLKISVDAVINPFSDCQSVETSEYLHAFVMRTSFFFLINYLFSIFRFNKRISAIILYD